MADETFSQALSGTLLPFLKMGLDQKSIERQAIRDQANILFQQGRQAAMEKHYADMDKRYAKTAEQQTQNEQDKLAFQKAQEERDLRRDYSKNFQLNLGRGFGLDQAHVMALGDTGLDPNSQNTPAAMRNHVDELFKQYIATVPPVPAPGQGMPTMPTVVSPSQEQPNSPAVGFGGAVGAMSPQDSVQQPPSVPFQSQGGFQVAPNMNIQPSETPYPVGTQFPMTREQFGKQQDPLFLANRTKEIQANAIKQQMADAATARAINSANAIQVRSDHNVDLGKAAMIRAEAYANINGKGGPREQLMKASADLMGIKEQDIQDWHSFLKSDYGTKLQQGWARIQNSGDANLIRAANGINRNDKAINDIAAKLQSQLKDQMKLKSDIQSSLAYIMVGPTGENEDQATKIKRAQMLAAPQAQIDKLNLQLNGDPNDPSKPGFLQLKQEADAFKSVMPLIQKTKDNGQPALPPKIQQGLGPPTMPGYTPTAGSLPGLNGTPAPARQYSVEEASKLPKGTRFMGKNGKWYTRS